MHSTKYHSNISLSTNPLFLKSGSVCRYHVTEIMMLLYRYMAAIVFFFAWYDLLVVSIRPISFFRYTKYLYPFECTKRNLSNPTELQAAIEGNKREGRRGSYGAYPEMALSGLHPGVPPGHPGLPSQISPMSLVTGPRFNGNGTSHPMPPSELLNYLTESPSTYLLT